MHPRANTLYTIALIVTFVSVSAFPCLGFIDLLGIGFGVPFNNPCLQSIVNVRGCIEELASSFLTLQPRILGTQCCRAALSVDDNCWPKIFPYNPFFPPLIKNYCATVTQLPLPLPPPVYRPPL